jgi:ankyrin repeat protein
MACVDLSKPGILDFIKFLLEKGANPNLADLEGKTPLHNLAFYRSTAVARRRNNQPGGIDNEY